MAPACRPGQNTALRDCEQLEAEATVEGMRRWVTCSKESVTEGISLFKLASDGCARDRRRLRLRQHQQSHRRQALVFLLKVQIRTFRFVYLMAWNGVFQTERAMRVLLNHQRDKKKAAVQHMCQLLEMALGVAETNIDAEGNSRFDAESRGKLTKLRGCLSAGSTERVPKWILFGVHEEMTLS